MLRKIRVFFQGIAGILAVIVALVTSIGALWNAVQSFFPWIGPFKATINIKNVRVIGVPKLVQNDFILTVEFSETNAGTSRLDKCVSELLTSNQNFRSLSEPDQRLANTTDIIKQEFKLPKNQYSVKASLRRSCINMVSDYYTFELPPVSDNISKNITYIVCRGQYKEGCTAGLPWVGCGSVSEEIKKIYPNQCKSVVSERLLNNRRGNACGYGDYEVTCSQ